MTVTGLYLDAYSGVSGDMFLGVLLDLGVPLSHLSEQLGSLSVSGWRLEAETASQHGITGTRAKVVLEETQQPHRHLSDIRAIIANSGLAPQVKADVVAVFRRLAEAEAKVHGTGVEEVHFHEVGAVDAIVDIVGVCLGLRYLGIQQLACSPLPLGTGFVKAAHGLLPVPAPATLEILSTVGASVLPGKGEGEMVTPTGAALVAHFGRFGNATPAIRPHRTGYGFGTRELPWPNALRAILARHAPTDSLDSDETTLLECNIDDMNPELVPYVVERLLEQGALDAWSTPIGMKKGRPAIMLSALATAGEEANLARTLLVETTTLGVRYSPWKRFKAGRESRTVQTPWGGVRVKVKLLRGAVAGAAPEYEDCARLARDTGTPLREVYDAAAHAAREDDASDT
ncbi:MAG: nickel pincer cofactor biosynthesis protein LarC [Chloroflexota bacterium]|nr:nickel pincer cofactor biosynthesis protein LarC [Chloroflexota bacterium]